MLRVAIAMIGFCLVSAVWAQNLAPNPSFETGDERPAGWQVEGEGNWVSQGHSGDHAISLTGSPERDLSLWRCPAGMLQPGHTYRFAFWVKSVDATGGCVVSGPGFANRDFGYTTTWQPCEFIFVVPPELPADAQLRLGMWSMRGTLLFDDVVLQEVIPVHAPHGDVLLAAGEQLEGATYRFAPDFAYEGSNYSPLLVDYTCGFNSNRWPFGPGASLTYRQGIPGASQKAARVSVNLGYHTSGDCIVEASRDAQTWQSVGRLGKLGSGRFELPDALFPAEQIYVRLRSPGEGEPPGDAAPGSFQVTGYEYEAQLDRDLGQVRGTTRFLQVNTSRPDLTVTVLSLGELQPGQDNVARLRLRNNTAKSMELRVNAAMASPPATPETAGELVSVPAAEEVSLEVKYALDEIPMDQRRNSLVLTVRDRTGPLFAAQCPVAFTALQAGQYGYLIQPGGPAAPTLWWCEGPYKVSRDRPAPRTQDPVVRLSAAGNEFEAAQVVLRFQHELRGLTAQVEGPAGLPGVRWTVDQVAYHYVSRPTDEAGCVGWWPDALPPIKEPLDLAADQNHPLWLTVYVPPDSRPGTYRAQLRLSADGWRASVPIELRVYGFTLSKEPHLESGFGLSEGTIAQYHNLTSPEQRRQVWDLYMQNFRDHRLSPYTFAPFDPFTVRLSGGADAWQGGEFDTTDPAAGAQCLKITDDSETVAVTVNHTARVAVQPDVAYRLSWKVRTAYPGQEYLITLGQHGTDGAWMPGRNLDLAFAGDVTWQTGEFIIPAGRLTPDTAQLSLSLRPVLWSEGGERVGTAWFDDLYFGKADGGPNLLTDPGFETRLGDIQVTADFAAWDEQAKRYLDDYGFANFTLPMMSLAGMSFNRDGSGHLGPYRQGTEGYERLYAQAAMLVQQHLQEHGWLRKGYVYWYDEPEPRDYPYVSEGMRLIKRGAPLVRRMLTEEPVPELFGDVDIWCPVESNLVPEATAARQAGGETIWWYVCTGPKAPWPGLFIDHSAVDLRVWLWLTVKYNVQGILIWTTNWWTSSAAFPDQPQNPWEDPMGYVAGYGFQPGQVAYWGNGDGRLLYPPNRDVNTERRPYVEGPVNCIRWEMLRDGCDDWEYFYELRQALAAARQAGKPAALIAEAEKLLAVPKDVVDSPTEFNPDPRPLLEHRERLADMLERLKR
ncbi:MAG: DUF4091 domain-containing protein [Armatimonadetes bacterium]|nr:DUF4091 domain-containing protein [Armatimonadota bacterium]